MGGPGSGNHGERWDAKPSTEERLRFDLSRLYRGGWLRPGAAGTATWSRGGTETASIGWAVRGTGETATALELDYAVGGEAVRYLVPLTWTACRFGGRRPWFVCPGEGCGRRAAVLYGGRYFLCRTCQNLAYASTRESAGERATRKAQRIRMRLGGTADPLAPFPPKPKGMHWRTYERIVAEINAREHPALVAFAAETDALLARLERARLRT